MSSKRKRGRQTPGTEARSLANNVRWHDSARSHSLIPYLAHQGIEYDPPMFEAPLPMSLRINRAAIRTPKRRPSADSMSCARRIVRV